MSLPVVLVGGNKGGVGKSLCSMALLDYWLSQNKPVFLVETDRSNPDVAKAYGDSVPHCLPEMRERDGWIDLVNELEEKVQHSAIVINLAAQSNRFWEDFGAILLEGLQEMKRKPICLWMINRQKDSLELLMEFQEMAPGVKLHVVRNGYFGDERKFELYHRELQAGIEKAGGQSVTFPELADRITDQLYTNRQTIAAVASSGMLGDRSEVQRWRKACSALFAEVGL